ASRCSAWARSATTRCGSPGCPGSAGSSSCIPHKQGQFATKHFVPPTRGPNAWNGRHRGRVMSQRPSGYARKPDEEYATIAWPILALLATRRTAPVGRIWDPCCGVGKLVAVLRIKGFDAIGTDTNFLATTTAPAGVSDLVTNPPYGASKRGELAVKFIEH